MTVFAEWCGRRLQPIGSPYRFPYHFPSRLTPSSHPTSRFARKALSTTPGLAPGGLGTRQVLGFRGLEKPFFGGSPLHERKGIPLPTRQLRGALQKNDTCVGLVLLCTGSLDKCHLRASAKAPKGSFEGTPRYTTSFALKGHFESDTWTRWTKQRPNRPKNVRKMSKNRLCWTVVFDIGHGSVLLGCPMISTSEKKGNFPQKWHTKMAHKNGQLKPGPEEWNH